jgi:hypothetical protein
LTITVTVTLLTGQQFGLLFPKFTDILPYRPTIWTSFPKIHRYTALLQWFTMAFIAKTEVGISALVALTGWLTALGYTVLGQYWLSQSQGECVDFKDKGFWAIFF